MIVIYAITLDGTVDGTYVHDTTTIDGDPGIVTTKVLGKLTTDDIGTTTGDVHFVGIMTEYGTYTVLGTEITVTQTVEGIDTITVDGTDDGRLVYAITAIELIVDIVT
jgi:hypothetical protein